LQPELHMSVMRECDWLLLGQRGGRAHGHEPQASRDLLNRSPSSLPMKQYRISSNRYEGVSQGTPLFAMRPRTRDSCRGGAHRQRTTCASGANARLQLISTLFRERDFLCHWQLFGLQGYYRFNPCRVAEDSPSVPTDLPR
jgi:hypothetical protein